MRRLRYSVPYIAGKNLPKDSDPAPCGAGLTATQSSSGLRYFNPPAPCGAGQLPALCRYALTYFNPPAPCGAGLGSSCFAWRASNFNPPAPCGAGQQLSAAGFRDRDFNPPAPCGAGPRTTAYQITQIYFNPPAPCGAGPCGYRIPPPLKNFNPPAPCGAGRPEQLKPRAWVLISIHPPLAGRDYNMDVIQQNKNISIHPPLAGRDSGASYGSPWRGDFNPPAPCGAGPVPLSSYTPPLLFQSTRPLRGGTAILHKKTVQNIAYCTKSAFTLAVLSGFPALMRPFFCQTCTNFGANLPKNRCSLPVRTLIPSGPPPADSRH